MQIGDMIIESETINSQIMYIPSIKQWDVLLKENPVIDGKKLVHIGFNTEGMLNTLYGLLDFVKTYPIFSISFFQTVPQRPWYFCVLIKYGDILQRVNIEQLNCEKCSWKGSVANPTDPSLYAGSIEKTEAIENAWSISTVSCPKCGAKLKGHPIWTEPV